MNRLLFVVLVSCSTFTVMNGQDATQKIQGRVYSADEDVASVHVSNISTNRGTITDASGYFEILGRLSDTLVFSAVQFKKKQIAVTQEILDTPLFLVPLEDALTELEEVVVRPYNLTGDISRDMGKLGIGKIFTASTEGLPNAHIKTISPSQRKLYTASSWNSELNLVTIDPLFNYFSGRTKMLNQRIAREARTQWMEEVRSYYPDSLYVQELKIPEGRVGDFVYSCENDSLFEATAKNGDRLQLWEVLKKKSSAYLKVNSLDKDSGN